MILKNEKKNYHEIEKEELNEKIKYEENLEIWIYF